MNGHTWVFGKAESGWYMARWGWDRNYSEHLVSLGYRVEQSMGNPDLDRNKV